MEVTMVKLFQKTVLILGLLSGVSVQAAQQAGSGAGAVISVNTKKEVLPTINNKLSQLSTSLLFKKWHPHLRVEWPLLVSLLPP